MRKLSLLAAAAMVAGGSAFAMDGGGVSISGEANFGVKFKENDGGANAPNELQFHHEFDIKFSASGTTDGGIGFGGSVSIDNTESVTGAGKGAKAAQEKVKLGTPAAAAIAFNAGETLNAIDARVFTGDIAANTVVTLTDDGKILSIEVEEDAANRTGKNHFVLSTSDVEETLQRAIVVIDGKPEVVSLTGEENNWIYDATAEGGPAIYKVGPGAGPMTAATAATFDPDASQTVGNHGEIYISMDMHKLTIGSDIDAADKLAGGLADPGFDGIGIDDEAERVWGGSAADVRYDGDFGVASVAVSYGDKAGDAEWAAGFSFNVEPVTFGAGFDSKGVMSIGMGFTQGQISMNALYSTDSDHDEADSEALKPAAAAENKAATYVTRANKPDLKNQAMGVDLSYQMSEDTSLVLVAAQHKKESAKAYYNKATGDGATGVATSEGSTTNTIQRWVKSSTTVDAFGVGFSHDLGGGATLKAGAGSVDSNAVADLGITMKF
ncbi:MAG: porin [Rhodobacteraceae bacterium]|nr:porin [Paracoccaceae bacterium]